MQRRLAVYQFLQSRLLLLLVCGGFLAPCGALGEVSWPDNMVPFTMPWTTIGSGALDLSFLLDPPAGKHGFVESRDGKLLFEDGTRAKFWGVNLVAAACFPPHEIADSIARRLAHHGCNMVRFHHMDAPWHDLPLIDYAKGDSRHLHPERLDRLDYLISRLKDAGVYVHMDLMVHRKFMPGDDVLEADKLENGQKHVSYTNRRLIELQKEYAEQLLTHENPYTGLRYVDDPAIATIMLVNENSIFWTIGDDIPAAYIEEIDAAWNKWLLDKYGSREVLAQAWTTELGRSGLAETEDPSHGTVERPPVGEWQEQTFSWERDNYGSDGHARVADHILFLQSIQSSFFGEMVDFLRSLGVRCSVAGSNLPNGVASLPGFAGVGLTEMNNYWGHPLEGYGMPNRFPNAHQVSTSPYDSLAWWFTRHHPTVFLTARVADTPLISTEWNEGYPNRYRAELIPFVAAYSAFQDYDGLLLFDYAGGNWSNIPSEKMGAFFDSGNDPAVWGPFAAGALIFLRGDVSPGRVSAEIVYSATDVLDPQPECEEPFKFLPFVFRTAQRFIDHKYDGDADLVISSGFSPTGDYSTANRAILYARSPYTNAYTLHEDRVGWLAPFVPTEQLVAGIRCSATFEDFGWESRSVRTTRGPLFPPTIPGDLVGICDNGYGVGLLTDRFLFFPDVRPVSHADNAWEARIVLDAARRWGLIDSGREMIEEGWFRTDTGELFWDCANGRFTIDTPYCQGFVGHATGTTIRLENVAITPRTDFCTVLATSLTQSPIRTSNRILMVAVGRCRNSGDKWEEDEERFRSMGSAPVLIEPISAEIELILDHSQPMKVFALTAGGDRETPVDADRAGDRSVFTIGGSSTIYYEILYESSAVDDRTIEPH
ncbi:MAG: hypothetical protein ABIH23_00190 [bacterium]